MIRQQSWLVRCQKILDDAACQPLRDYYVAVQTGKHSIGLRPSHLCNLSSSLFIAVSSLKLEGPDAV